MKRLLRFLFLLILALPACSTAADNSSAAGKGKIMDDHQSQGEGGSSVTVSYTPPILDPSARGKSNSDPLGEEAPPLPDGWVRPSKEEVLKLPPLSLKKIGGSVDPILAEFVIRVQHPYTVFDRYQASDEEFEKYSGTELHLKDSDYELFGAGEVYYGRVTFYENAGPGKGYPVLGEEEQYCYLNQQTPSSYSAESPESSPCIIDQSGGKTIIHLKNVGASHAYLELFFRRVIDGKQSVHFEKQGWLILGDK